MGMGMGMDSGPRKLIIDYSVLIIVLIVIRFFLVGQFTVEQTSMQPSINPDDRLLVNRIAYIINEPERTDIIILTSPTTGDVLVKRILGTEGDRISSDGERIFVNDVPVIDNPSDVTEMLIFEDQVPPNHIFVIGDNLFSSLDSRTFGSVPEDLIIGKVIFKFDLPF